MRSFHGVLKALSHFIGVFLLVAFLISCCMMLFVTIFAGTVNLALTNENLAEAAKLTFINVVALSLLLTVADRVRRYLMLDRPAKRITEGAKRIMEGDFSVQIPHMPNDAHQFELIIDTINNMARELSGVETLRTDFIANVSHEMKTPLAAMLNYGTLLQQPGLDAQQRMDYARSVCLTAKRMDGLMTNILKLNRLENQQIFPQCGAYDLSAQLCDCLLQFEEVWERQDIQIETDIDDDVTVKADQELLSLVWNNLLSNAFKFTPSGGRVSVSLKADSQQAVVTVADTGCGMSPQTGRHIFEKFYQGDTSHATAGNGLGLALVKRVMDITQATISVESAPGKGSAFTVSLRRD